jgi:hypothetical protein
MWWSIFTPKNLSNSSPSGASLLELSTDGLDVVIILGLKAPKILEYLNPFKDISIDSELLP